MNANLSLLTLAVAVVVTCSHVDSALAEEPLAPAQDAAFFNADESTPAAAAQAPLFGDGVVAPTLLAEQRGGTDIHNELSKITATGTVSEVSVTDSLSGFNLITEGSFAGTSGIPMVIQNSGHGVLIQNAVIVNVDVQ